MKFELTIVADVFIDENSYPTIAPNDVLKGVIIQNSDIIDGFEITTSIPNLDNTKDFFFTSAKIMKKKLIKDTFYFLVHRKHSDTWHIGYVDDSGAGMIDRFPGSTPESYKSKKVASEIMNSMIVGIHDKKALDVVYEIDKLFDRKDAVAFVERLLHNKTEENRNENNPCKKSCTP